MQCSSFYQTLDGLFYSFQEILIIFGCRCYFWILRWQYLPKKHMGIFTILMIILAFLVGATNENIGPVFLVITYFYYVCSKNPRIKQYTYPCTFSCLAGFVILLAHNTGKAASQKGHAFQIGRLLME